MKVPDYILNLINREVNPHLESGKRYDDIGFSTREPHVLVDAIFSIVEDEETFNEFMRSNDDDECLGNLTKDEVATVTKRFMELMKYLGAELTEEKKKRLSAIEEFIQPEKNKSALPKREGYEQFDPKELFTKAMTILNSRQEIERFMYCKQNNEPYDGFPQDIIYKYIDEGLSHFLGPIGISKQIYKAIRWFSIVSYLLKDSKKFDSEEKMNPDFEKSVLQSINEADSPDKVALDVYTAFNSEVTYDNNVFALGVDMSNQALLDIYNKKISEIKKGNEDVSCKLWAEAYAYLLAQKGFDSYIVVARIHKRVVAFKGTTAILADGTAYGRKRGDDSSLNDIVRGGLGVRPTFFVAYTFDGESHVIDSIDPLKVSYDEEKITDASESTLHSALKKILFINQMLNEASLDSSGEVSYARCISNKILNDEENKILSINYNFFQGFLFPARDCIRTPIISINIGDSNAGENYLYFLLDHESHSFHPISKQEIIKRIASGMLSPGVGIQQEEDVPGIPGSSDLDAVTRARADYRLNKEKERKITSPMVGDPEKGWKNRFT